MRLFKKKYPVDKEFANFSGQYIGTGEVGAYIIWLYKNKGISHLGYRYKKKAENYALLSMSFLITNGQKAISKIDVLA